jgi:hypothetical protein
MTLPSISMPSVSVKNMPDMVRAMRTTRGDDCYIGFVQRKALQCCLLVSCPITLRETYAWDGDNTRELCIFARTMHQCHLANTMLSLTVCCVCSVFVVLLQSGIVQALLAKPATDLAALQNVITALTTKPNITMPSLSLTMPDLVRGSAAAAEPCTATRPCLCQDDDAHICWSAAVAAHHLSVVLPCIC